MPQTRLGTGETKQRLPLLMLKRFGSAGVRCLMTVLQLDVCVRSSWMPVCGATLGALLTCMVGSTLVKF